MSAVSITKFHGGKVAEIRTDRMALLVSMRHGKNPTAEDERALFAMAIAPRQHEEMVRHLLILERLEADPELWERMTEGTGIATLNGYRAAIAISQAVVDAAANEHLDEVLGALRVMVDYAESPDFDGAPSDAALQQARAVIAKVDAARRGRQGELDKTTTEGGDLT